MPAYILYCFAGDKIDQCDRFKAADDAQAIEEANRRHDGRAAELWRGNYKIEAFAAQDVFKAP
jgi:hypothetical protein